MIRIAIMALIFATVLYYTIDRLSQFKPPVISGGTSNVTALR